MDYSIYIGGAVMIIGILLIAHIADIYELKNFRENLVPGMNVVIKIDTGDKAIAKVTKMFYDPDYPTCSLSLLVNEEYVELNDVPINSVFKPNSYRI